MGVQLNAVGPVSPAYRLHRARGFGVLPCPSCGDTLLAPDHSQYLGDGRVQHSWSCDACGHEFKASIDVAPR
jgi:predicted RNA-binding Zn-ribbon protein involved in translation (DUF1610 family)